MDEIGLVSEIAVEFQDCTFVGSPPKGFATWSVWAGTKPKRGVVIRTKASHSKLVVDLNNTKGGGTNYFPGNVNAFNSGCYK